MRAREIMSQPVVAVRLSTSVREAAGLLDRMGYTALPVLDEDDHPVGMVTEHDLIRDRIPHDPRVYPSAPAVQGSETTVETVMSTPIESITPGADIADIAEMMVRERIRVLPVTDGSRLVGIITRRDLLRHAVAHDDGDLVRKIQESLRTLDPDPDRFAVTVTAGVASIEDHRRDPETDATATRIARAIPGVVAADTQFQTTDPF